MPLHPDDEVRTRHLDSLDDTVAVAGTDHQTVAEPIDRLVVMVIPVFALLVPIVKFAPALYGWRVRSRIYRRYGELKFLEAEVGDNPTPAQREAWLARLDAIERDVNHIPTPLAFSDMLYTLRSHIALVREAIGKRPTTGA